MFTSLGFRAYNYVDPTVDISNPLLGLNGTVGRVLAKTPPVDPFTSVDFLRFCREIVPTMFGKLSRTEVMTIEQWIEQSPYTALQKARIS